MEVTSLEELIHIVDGEKYSCHASSVLDINNVTDHLGAMTVNPKEVSTTGYQGAGSWGNNGGLRE
jgi:hypothetical protein